MASRRRATGLLAELEAEGVPGLDKLHVPAGHDLGGKGPGEIAPVSRPPLTFAIGAPTTGTDKPNVSVNQLPISPLLLSKAEGPPQQPGRAFESTA